MVGENLLALARQIALVAHDGQSRKGNGEAYFNHVERVAGRVTGWEAKTVAYLHDVVEDTDVSLDFLDALFPLHIVDAVEHLTRRAPWDYAEYIERLVGSGTALSRTVKIADLLDNLSTIEDIDPEKQGKFRARYSVALERLRGV